jgi:hypothetical protein
MERKDNKNRLTPSPLDFASRDSRNGDEFSTQSKWILPKQQAFASQTEPKQTSNLNLTVYNKGLKGVKLKKQLQNNVYLVGYPSVEESPTRSGAQSSLL